MIRSIGFSLLLLLAASVSLGQMWPPPPPLADPYPAPSWGVTDETALIVSSFEMLPYAEGVVIDTVFSTAKRYIATTAFHRMGVLPLELPRGATITRIEAEACNDDGTGEAFVALANFTDDAPPPIAEIAIPTESGCGTFSSAPISHEVALAGPYALLWSQSLVGPTQRLALVRVYYRLQVSPAPPTATFGDVPVGSALHQYVEALAAAGITVGCGDGNYCPGDPVTRGQLAVFLAKALGLHWASAPVF